MLQPESSPALFQRGLQWWDENKTRFRLSNLRGKLVGPYLILTVIVAMVGTFIATRLAFGSAQERFERQLIEAANVAADGVVQKEVEHLTELRGMVFTQDVDTAVLNRDVDLLRTRILPWVVNKQLDVVAAFDTTGREILTLARVEETQEYLVSNGSELLRFPPLDRVLRGEQDEQGDKFAGLLKTRQGWYLFTVAPVRLRTNNQLVGAMMVGTNLESLLIELEQFALADLSVLNPEGELLETTFAPADQQLFGGGLEVLNFNGGLQSATTTLRSIEVYGRPFEVADSPLVIRQQELGILSAAQSSNFIVDSAANSRNFISFLFSLMAGLVVVLGFLLAYRIAKPILRLRAISQAVASGDLNQKTGLELNDEIGDLAVAFDAMTNNLRDRTEVAARLYAETVQRNQELAETNQRLRTAQQQLVQSEKMSAIGQLTAGIVHDVKNPLAAINGLAELMEDDTSLKEDQRQNMTLIRESANRASRIVNDLMKFARQSNLEMAPGDLRTTVETVLRLTGYMAREAQVRVLPEIPNTGMVVMYDAQLIEQVLINLVQNAIQAMRANGGGVLRLKMRHTEEWVAVTVQDTGSGIHPDHLNKIFDPFFTTKPAGEGTGLGLAVSYGIVSNHGGRIEVESQIGVGSTFTVWLPVNPPQTQKPGTGPINSLAINRRTW